MRKEGSKEGNIMSFEPCQNCGKPVAVRGLCADCGAAVWENAEATYLTDKIMAAGSVSPEGATAENGHRGSNALPSN